jgi:hypothetical protein
MADMHMIRVACLAYQREYGTWPTGTLDQVYQSLTGSNTRHILFIEIPEHRLTRDRRFADPWRSPYRIDFVTPTNVVIRSAGEDRVWDTADDLRKD